MATSVPVPMARPRSAWASAAASLTPSPTIATTASLVLQAAHDVDLVLGQHLGDDVVGRDADLGGDRRRGRARLSPVSRTGRSPRSRSSAIAAALVGLTVSATTSSPRTAPSQPTSTAVRPAASASSWAARSVVVEVHRPVGEQPLAADDDAVAVDDAGHAESLRCWRTPRPAARAWPAARAPSAMARAIGCSDASSSDAGEAQHARRGRCRAGRRRRRRAPSARSSPCRSCRARSCRRAASTRAPRDP